MYQCSFCRQSGPGPRLLHRSYRANGDIARELPICRECQREIKAGADPQALLPPPPPLAPVALEAVKALEVKRSPPPAPGKKQPSRFASLFN